jgi:hypothetical protein
MLREQRGVVQLDLPSRISPVSGSRVCGFDKLREDTEVRSCFAKLA